MVERTHRQLKDALRARLAGSDWPLHLPWVLLGLRAAPKEDSGISSAELLFGTTLALPGQLVTAAEPPVADFVRLLRTVDSLPTRALPEPPPEAPPAALASADMVYVRRGAAAGPLAPQYTGPFAVIEKRPKFFRLQVGDREEAVTVDRLKPHLGSSPLLPAVPPRRGRPALVRDGCSYAAAVTGGGYCGGATSDATSTKKSTS
jgi:hypothetical protein